MLHRTFWVCAAVLYCLSSPVRAAGIQLFNQGPALSGAIWYPCAGEPKRVELGDLAVAVDYGLQGVKDCRVTGAKLPLIVISHGTNGWFGGHHDTAAALADAGFVVAAINHPGDSAKDNARSGELSVFLSRPADMIRLIDFVLNDWKGKAIVDPARIGLFGFSAGGYTSLELIGVVHSHTHTEPYPSPTDVAQAPDPGWHYVICSLKRELAEVRSYRIIDGSIEEETITLL